MSKMIPSRIYFSSLVLYVLVFYLYFFLTKFEKKITVSEELLRGQYKHLVNMIADARGEIYVLKEVLLLWSFDASENIARVEPGKTYLVKGYGVRVPFLALYPTITSVKSSPPPPTRSR